MPGLTKWKRVIRGANTFQVILLAILFHSLASIFVIYLHLMWFFADEEKGWKKSDDFIILNRGSIVWNRRFLQNVLSSRIISSNEMSLNGWWMDHSKWEIDIRCFNQKLAICSKAFSTSCKPDGIRAIYQYVTFSKDAQVKTLEMSVIATADQLEAQAAGAAYGIFGVVKLNDGSLEKVEIKFPVNIEPLTQQNVKFTAIANKYVVSVTLMMMCYGYSGNVHFTDPVLLSTVQHKLINDVKCPQKIGVTNSAHHGIIKIEKLFKPTVKSSKERQSLVTLVTQLSMDRLSVLERSLRLWDGPVSLVVYVPVKGTSGEDTDWQRLYVQKKLKSLNLSSQSHITLAFGHTSEKDYPINGLRNIAVRQANTKYILLVDADFQPSADFQQRFASSLKHFSHSGKLAFIIPAFEYIELPQKSDSVPQTKEELLQLLHREDPFILPFRMTESSESHRTTDYWKWYRANKAYFINTFNDKYEPYIIVQKTGSLPLYDERFLGYGMNKVTHVTELFAANYTFAVLPDLWVIHLPHKISSYTVEFLQNPHQRLKNRLERFEFLSDVMRKYRIGPCKHQS